MKLLPNAPPILTLSSGSWSIRLHGQAWARRCDFFSCSGTGAGDPVAGDHPRGRLRSRGHQAVIVREYPIPEQPVPVPAPPRRVNLIVDIQERLRSGKGAAYARWAKVYNLKQMAAALQFMQEQNITEYDQLSAKVEDAVSRFHSLSEQLRRTELTCPQPPS